MLSLALGYDVFPQGAGSEPLQAFVYGLEYEHALPPEPGGAVHRIRTSFRPRDRRRTPEPTAYGNHTRLGLGPDFRLDSKDDLVTLLDYNALDLPYFELSSARLTYATVALRYQRRL